VADVGASLSAIRRRSSPRGVRGLLTLLIVYPIIHFAYGLGGLAGLRRLWR
jgi:hypothetical protein